MSTSINSLSNDENCATSSDLTQSQTNPYHQFNSNSLFHNDDLNKEFDDVVFDILKVDPEDIAVI
jgi:hypothetical protein